LTELVFDLEGNGLIPELTTLWCLVIADVETGTVVEYNDQGAGCPPIIAGLLRLTEPGVVPVAHNGLGYDVHAIRKIHPDIAINRHAVRDTMVMGRLYNPERRGGHSIEAYGEEFGIIKDVGADDFSQWSARLQARCVDDVRTTLGLYRKLKPKLADWGESVQLEHDVAWIIGLQMANGFPFDVRLGQEVAAEYDDERKQIERELQAIFPPILVRDGKDFAPKRDNEAQGYCVGAALTKLKWQDFNPGSGEQIALRFKRKYNWKPKKFTDSGIPATDEEVLKTLTYPEAKLLARYMRVNKMWTQIAGPFKVKKGRNTGGGWLLHVGADGRIRGYVNSNGAVTGRMTHSKPNTANVDKKEPRLRAMWIPRVGWVLVGSDAEGLELRMLAHYLAKYDGGSYAVALVAGDKTKGTDVHTRTIVILGMVERDNGKRVIYAMIYGAGDPKLGTIIIEDALEAGRPKPQGSKKALGANARAKLETGIVGLKELKDAIKKAVKRGWVRSLDGRKIRIRSEHAALNTLLQGAGAIVMKKALVYFTLPPRRGDGSTASTSATAPTSTTKFRSSVAPRSLKTSASCSPRRSRARASYSKSAVHYPARTTSGRPGPKHTEGDA
jgi:DNA polymerase-1